jgi:hypothetical protein
MTELHMYKMYSSTVQLSDLLVASLAQNGNIAVFAFRATGVVLHTH